MTTPTTHFNLAAPSPATKFKDLGAELLAFATSIDNVLASFDYNGSDPNAVLARVAALEAWKTLAEPRIAALETTLTLANTSIAPSAGTTVKAQTSLRKRGDGYVSGYLIVERTSADFVNGGTLVTLPTGWRPNISGSDGQEFTALVSFGGQSMPAVMQVLNTGVVRIWQPSGGWVNNRRCTVNLGFHTA